MIICNFLESTRDGFEVHSGCFFACAAQAAGFGVPFEQGSSSGGLRFVRGASFHGDAPSFTPPQNFLRAV